MLITHFIIRSLGIFTCENFNSGYILNFFKFCLNFPGMDIRKKLFDVGLYCDHLDFE